MIVLARVSMKSLLVWCAILLCPIAGAARAQSSAWTYDIFVNECNEDGKNEFPQACIDAASVDRARIHETVGNAAVKFFDASLDVRRAK